MVRDRLAAWSARLTVSEVAYLPQRLNGQGISLSLAAAACSPELAYEYGDMHWVDPFMDGLAEWGREQPDDEDVPFADLLGGFLKAGERLVCGLDATGAWKRLAAPARASAVKWLIQRVAGIAQWSLYFCFDEYRRTESQGDHYRSFVSTASSQDWANDFFTTFAGLARPIGTATVQWSRMVTELLAHWEGDRSDLADEFGFSATNEIAALTATGSDLHNHGRSVVFVELTDGTRLVHKPTSSELTSLWIRAQEATLGRREDSPRLLRRSDHSWHQFLTSDTQDAHQRQALEPNQYEHLGRLLAVATALGACDLHVDNYVQYRGLPELVDHETILTPAVRPGIVPGTGALRKAIRDLQFSVLTTGALPRWNDGPDGELWTINALGLALRDHTGGLPILRQINAENMSVSHQVPGPSVMESAETNFDGIGAPLSQGFAEGWRAVIGARGKLEALLEDVRSDVRVVLRDTRYYLHLLTEGYMPRHCCDVLDRSLLFERLYRPLLGGQAPEEHWELCRLEHDALIRGDVPSFVTAPSELALREVGARERAPIRLSGSAPLTHARQNVRAMRPADEYRNVALIRSALEAAAWPARTVRSVEHSVRSRVRSADDWKCREEVARGLFTSIRRAAYRHRDGSVAFVGPYLSGQGRAQAIGAIPTADTYSGIAGLGLLAAALSRCSSSSIFREWAHCVADSLVMASGHLEGRDRAGRCGAYAGVGGTAFVIAKIGALLGEAEYEDVALSLFLAHSADTEDAETGSDVVSGWAGVCLVGGALAMRRAESADLRRYLERSARRLIDAAEHDHSRATCWWPSARNRSGLSGFAHGAAGIAAALSRVERQGLVEPDGLVDKAFAYEHNLFDPKSETWPAAESRAANVWCYGSAGILLALTETELDGVARSSTILDRAIAATLDSEPDGDGLCHGVTGVALCELCSGRRLEDGQLRASGMRRLSSLARRCSAGGQLRLEPVSTLGHSCGLMCGATGLAFALVAPEVGAEAIDLLAVA